MDRRRLVHRQDAEALQALGPLQHLRDDAGTFIRGLETVASKARHVKQDVCPPRVGYDEAVTLGDIEPLDDAGELDDGGCGVVSDIADDVRLVPQSLWNAVCRHDVYAAAPQWRLLLQGRFANL
jgi:hypothetical protein